MTSSKTDYRKILDVLSEVALGHWSRTKAAEELNMSEYEFSVIYGELLDGLKGLDSD